MTIDIYKDKAGAELQAKGFEEIFNTNHEVIKVKIDQSQEDTYGFRYYDTHPSWTPTSLCVKLLVSLDVGYIIIDEDWTAEEAAKCGLVEIQEEV